MNSFDLTEFAPALPPIEGDTRARLLEAGLRLFAAHGYDGVSTRQLASTAGVNIAAIGYHFGGKKELYHAVVEHQVAETSPIIGPVAAGVAAGIEACGNDRQALAQIVTSFVGGMLDAFTRNESMQLRAALIMREYAHPTDAFEILFAGRIEPLHKTITALVAAALDRTVDDPLAIVRAHAVIGQILIFMLARIVLFARLDWKSYGPDELQMVKNEVTQSVLMSLNLPLPQSDGE
ncbi:MAG: CerR family C-terminal domain-containing protein [Rhodospirillales bacterium]|nr:CerR family C-terminal domain-containing protein [Rhodospirillales bacterium]